MRILFTPAIPTILFFAVTCMPFLGVYPVAAEPVWTKYEQTFTSSRAYENPLYNLEKFAVRFTSPSGRTRTINGFWDGGDTWKVRFCPDEQGDWTYVTMCSDTTNAGLHRQKGGFTCTAPVSKLPLYTRGTLVHPKGTYYLAYADGTPFFWTACTAWNGALKSTDDEWKTYLQDRAAKGFNVIHLITTQWRGAAANRLGQVAFEGSSRIRLNPDFSSTWTPKLTRLTPKDWWRHPCCCGHCRRLVAVN